jgi:methylated-DNA-[protein]-cysteine S-methyltransferase
MPAAHYALFDTSIGVCALAWTGQGICRVWLPEGDAGVVALRASRGIAGEGASHWQGRPPGAVGHAVEAMTDLLGGGSPDLDGAPLDLGGCEPFEMEVYAVTRAIPRGNTLTYGEVARRIGAPGAARAVGQALGRNPVPIIVPCHRVVAAGAASGKPIGGFSAPGGAATKRRMLAIEGALPSPEPDLFGLHS